MMRWAVVAVLIAALGGACRESNGGGARGGGEDRSACQVLQALEGENVGVYPDLLRMDLSAEMRTALTEQNSGRSRTGGEIRSDTFTKARKVAALCAENGVVLSG